MIWYYLILFVTSLLTAVFSWLPQVETLPEILGLDIDAYLVLGMGYFYSFATAFWPLYDLFVGVTFYIGYLVLKMVLRFFLGHRAPQ